MILFVWKSPSFSFRWIFFFLNLLNVNLVDSPWVFCVYRKGNKNSKSTRKYEIARENILKEMDLQFHPVDSLFVPVNNWVEIPVKSLKYKNMEFQPTVKLQALISYPSRTVHTLFFFLPLTNLQMKWLTHSCPVGKNIWENGKSNE